MKKLLKLFGVTVSLFAVILITRPNQLKAESETLDWLCTICIETSIKCPSSGEWVMRCIGGEGVCDVSDQGLCVE